MASGERQRTGRVGTIDLYGAEPTELVFGVIAGVGSAQERFCEMLSDRLQQYRYIPSLLKVTRLIRKFAGDDSTSRRSYQKKMRLMDLGNVLREKYGSAILAVAAAAEIGKSRRQEEATARRATIIWSLKHADEVAYLRKIYTRGFYLFGLHTDPERRRAALMEANGGMTESQAEHLMRRDRAEESYHGQHTEDTHHLSDFFVADENNDDKLRNSIARALDLAFGNPFMTPTFNEFAMFLAFASSLRSANLARQVGAVIARNDEVLAIGANDCPRPGGGLYWPTYDDAKQKVVDVPNGRDHMRKDGIDSSAREKQKLIDEMLTNAKKRMGLKPEAVVELGGVLRKGLKQITEYGRSVHAEMEAIAACARSGISCRKATLYTTTFPCHNCAKHIVDAGISQVVFVEPYPKSRALELHDDSITLLKDDTIRTRFKPFIGIGPRQFFNLFSMSLSAGEMLERKSDDGRKTDWRSKTALPRVPMTPQSYEDHEIAALGFLAREGLEKSKEGK